MTQKVLRWLTFSWAALLLGAVILVPLVLLPPAFRLLPLVVLATIATLAVPSLARYLPLMGLAALTLLLFLIYRPTSSAALLALMPFLLGLAVTAAITVYSQRGRVNRVLLVRVGAGIALVAAVLAGYFYRQSLSEGHFFALVTAGGLILALLLYRDSLTFAIPAATADSAPIRRLPTAVGLVLILATAAINMDVPEEVSSNLQFVILVAGLGLFIWGAAGRIDHKVQIDRGEMIAVGAILLLALAVRVWQLETSVRLFIDEGNFTRGIALFYYDDDIDLLRPFTEVTAFPALYPFMQWHTTLVFGTTFTGLRIVSTVIGTLNVLAVYLLGRELFNRRVALAAALLLATFPAHLHFSRLGMNNIADPLFGVMALYFVTCGLKHADSRTFYFALAGGMLGLTQYFHESGRLTYAPLIILWLVILEMRLRFLSGRVLVRLVIVAVVVAFPVYSTLVAGNYSLATRMQHVRTSGVVTDNLDRPETILDHLGMRLSQSYGLHTAGPETSLYYGGDTPFLVGHMTPLFLLGLIYAFWLALRRRHIGTPLLLMWVFFAWIGIALTNTSLMSPRYIVTFPALALLMALGADVVMRMLWSPVTRNRLLAAIMGLVVALNLVYYFDTHLTVYNRQIRTSPDIVDAAFRAADLPDETRIYVVNYAVGRFVQADVLNYVGVEATTVFPQQVTPAFARSLVPTQRYAFLVPWIDQPSVNRLKRYIPYLQGPSFSPYDIPRQYQFALYTLND
jgi:hypothetical protein